MRVTILVALMLGCATPRPVHYPATKTEAREQLRAELREIIARNRRAFEEGDR